MSKPVDEDLCVFNMKDIKAAMRDSALHLLEVAREWCGDPLDLLPGAQGTTSSAYDLLKHLEQYCGQGEEEK